MKMGTRSKAKISKTLAIGTSDIKKKKLVNWEKMIVTKCMRNASVWVVHLSGG